MRISKIGDVKIPVRANETDAGIDLFIPNDFEQILLGPGESILIPSRIKVDVPHGHALIAFNKSGVAVKKELHVGACVIDTGYQGEIHINLQNVGKYSQNILAGDKIVQLVLLKLGDPVIEVVDEVDLYKSKTDRGEGGFGSSGTK